MVSEILYVYYWGFYFFYFIYDIVAIYPFILSNVCDSSGRDLFFWFIGVWEIYTKLSEFSAKKDGRNCGLVLLGCLQWTWKASCCSTYCSLSLIVDLPLLADECENSYQEPSSNDKTLLLSDQKNVINFFLEHN